MKTTLLKIATLLLMLTAARSSFANTVNPQKYTELTWVRNFYKIEVHGNVQLHLLSGEKEKVEINNTYYDHNALVQVESGVLRITCYRTERLDVWVTTNDLRALYVYDNVLVKTEGKFSALELDVELFNTAKADLDLEDFCTNIKLNDRSMADISGTAIESELASNYAATLNSANFNADQLLTKRMAPIWKTPVELAGLYDNALPGDIAAVKEVLFYTAATNQIKFAASRINITQNQIN